jgi:Stage II sporulation protein E (SpoIIE)
VEGPERRTGPDLGHLRPRDRLILVTDGVTEAQSPTGDFFGDARLEASAAMPPPEQIFASVQRFCAAQPLTDDCTAVELPTSATAMSITRSALGQIHRVT